jgi:hypothetical protein
VEETTAGEARRKMEEMENKEWTGGTVLHHQMKEGERYWVRGWVAAAMWGRMHRFGTGLDRKAGGTGRLGRVAGSSADSLRVCYAGESCLRRHSDTRAIHRGSELD